MTKAGPSLLKQALYLAAQNARREDPQIAALYDRLLRKGKHHNVILGAVAAHLAVRVYAVLKRNGKEAKTILVGTIAVSDIYWLGYIGCGA